MHTVDLMILLHLHAFLYYYYVGMNDVKILRRLPVTLLLFAGMANGLNVFAQDSVDMSDWQMLDDGEYTIQYPPDWELNQTGISGTNFVLFAPLESEIDSFRENVGLLIQDLSEYDLNLDQYTDLSEHQLNTMFPNSKLLESERRSDVLGEFHRLRYLGDSDVYHLMFIQHYWVRNKLAYVLTFTGEQSNFEDYNKTCEKIINSFRIK